MRGFFSCESGVGGLLGERRTVSEVTDPLIVWGSFFGSENSTPGVFVPGTVGVLVDTGRPTRGVLVKNGVEGTALRGVILRITASKTLSENAPFCSRNGSIPLLWSISMTVLKVFFFWLCSCRTFLHSAYSLS